MMYTLLGGKQELEWWYPHQPMFVESSTLHLIYLFILYRRMYEKLKLQKYQAVMLVTFPVKGDVN